VPASPREDGDGEEQDGVGRKSTGTAAVLQQSKGWHREVREGKMLLKSDFGKNGNLSKGWEDWKD